MRSVPRALLRLAALLVLAALLIGVPVAVFVTVGVPIPSAGGWREVWSTGRVDSDFVVRLGAAVFAVLWAWFALTALAELWRVLPRRRGECSPHDLRAVGGGPSGWVRGLVRFAAISSVGATATLGGFTVMTGASSTSASAAISAAPMPAETVVPSALGAAHLVVPGDSYWRIAEEHLQATLRRDPSPSEVADRTSVLVDVNAARLGHRDPTLIVPGELVVFGEPVAVPAAVDPSAPPPPMAPGPSTATPVTASPEPVPAPAPSTPAAQAVPSVVVPSPAAATPTAISSATSARGAFAAGLGTALLMSAGAIGAVEVRRRRQLRAGVVGSRLAAPTPEQVRTEVLLRALSAPERIARLDVALRSAARDLAGQRASVLAVILGDDGDVRLFVRGAAVPTAGPWQLDIHGGVWHLPAAVALDDLVPAARDAAQPCPALAHVGGVDEGGELFVDLEAAGVLSVESPWATQLVRAMASSLSISPFLESGRVWSVGVDDVLLGDGSADCSPGLSAALAAATMTLGSTGALARDVTTFSLRATGTGGEAWEPAVVLAAGVRQDDEALDDLVGVAGGRGLGVVVDTAVDGVVHRLHFDGDGHVFEPLGLRVCPVGFEPGDVAAVGELIRAADRVPEVHAPAVAIREPGLVAVFEEPEWSLLVRVLGQPGVVTPAGEPATFERSKSLELVLWLAMHRERPTRTAARTALWELDVRPATFANVVSDARRGLARAVAPPHGEEWIARTMTEELPLHARVVTDADLLAARQAAARGMPALDAIEVLRPGLSLVSGMVLAGTSLLWADAEGHTSSLVVLATGAAIELAQHYLAVGDVDGVFWATGQGLKVLAGHEELIALRMRAHARRGDLAGVRSEWASYERALTADPWAAGDPAPKLLALRRELLSPMAATAAAGR